MPTLAELLVPPCPVHPENRVREHYGVCDFCLMTKFKHLLPEPEMSDKHKAMFERLQIIAARRRRHYRNEGPGA